MEVILVLVMISIFAAIAVSRQPSTDVTLKAQAGTLKSHIRYAQMRAMNNDADWGIALDTNINKYWLFKNATSEKRILPGEDQSDVDLSAKGITIAADATRIFFEKSWGRPADHSASSVWLSKNQKTEMITITPETGFVP